MVELKHKAFDNYIEAERFAMANDGQMQPIRGRNDVIIPSLYYVEYTIKPKKKVYHGVYDADELTFYIDNKSSNGVGMLDSLLMDFAGRNIIITIDEDKKDD